MIDYSRYENYQLLVDVCESHCIPSDNWMFWIPAYYKETGELDCPETWKRAKEGGGDFTAHIRPGRDIRIKDWPGSKDYLIKVPLEGGLKI